VAKAVKIRFYDGGTAGGIVHGRFDFEMEILPGALSEYSSPNSMSSSYGSDWTNPQLGSAFGFRKADSDSDFWILVDFPTLMNISKLYL
jgi:hypothetical protein